MKNIVKYCEKCQNNPSEYKAYYGEILSDYIDLVCVGYYTIGENEDREFCKVHPDEKLLISPLSAKEFDILSSITNDIVFIHSMEDLKEKDPIEFQLKMSQFKANLSRTEEQESKTNKKKCPYCGHTEFTPVRKKWSFWAGFATNQTELICNNCGKKVE